VYHAIALAEVGREDDPGSRPHDVGIVVDQPGHPKEDVMVREWNHTEVDGLFVVVDLAAKVELSRA